MSKTLLFFGNERLVSGLDHTDAPVLRGLIEAGYTIAAVVSHHSDSKSRHNRPLEVAEVAAEHNIPVLLPDRPADIYDQLVSYGAEAAVLVAYGKIIPQRVIDIFPKGIINIHPSLLPQYRGPTPIESAVANGDTQTGVSIMELSAGMDEGAVYSQVKINVGKTDTKFDLYNKLAPASASLLIDILPSILDGTLQPIQQDNTEATYCQLLTKADSLLDLNQLTAQQAEQRVRAHLGFPKSKVNVFGKEIIVTKAHVSSERKTSLDLRSSDETYFSVDQLIGPSGREMSAKDFLNGYAEA